MEKYIRNILITGLICTTIGLYSVKRGVEMSYDANIPKIGVHVYNLNNYRELRRNVDSSKTTVTFRKATIDSLLVYEKKELAKIDSLRSIPGFDEKSSESTYWLFGGGIPLSVGLSCLLSIFASYRGKK